MIPLVAPTYTDTDRKAMSDGAYSGALFDERTVREFEEAFAAFVGCEWAVAVNSGTNALEIALVVTARMDEVTVPSYGCVAVLNALRHANAIYEFVDVSFDVRQALAQTMSCDLAVHLFGRETQDAVGGFIPDIEDWTLSLGGVEALTADFGVCSTHESKMISTGRGGIVFGNDADFQARTLELAHYEAHTGFGYSVAMSASQALLGLSQLKQLPDFIYRRRELAGRYTYEFQRAGIPCPDIGTGSVFFRYLIETTEPALKVAALAEKGIEAGRGVWPPLHQLAGLPDEQFPGTMRAVNSLLSVPVHPSITDELARHIIESVKEVCAP